MVKEKPGKTVKKSLGRPPFPQEIARNNRMVTFVTDAELQKINAIATQKQQSLSSVCHSILSDFLQQENPS